MTVEDLGLRRSTRRRKYSKNKHKEEAGAATSKKTDEYESKETVKKTPPVKTTSNNVRQTQATNSPIMKNLKRLQPRTVKNIATIPNNSQHKLQNSKRKSVNFKKLVSDWEQLGKSNLTPVVFKKAQIE
jgi:hypothetical protein